MIWELRNAMDQHPPSFGRSTDASSFFSEEPSFPSEKQVGFRKGEHVMDQFGNNSVSLSPLKQLHVPGANGAEAMKLPRSYILGNENIRLALEDHVSSLDRVSGPSTTTPRITDRLKYPVSSFAPNYADVNGSNYKNGLLSNSLPDLLNEKSAMSFNKNQFGDSTGTYSNFGEDEPFESIEEIEAQTIGNLLPDDDDLLSGVIDNIGYSHQLTSGDDIDDDIFYSGGGIELEIDDSRTHQFVGEGISSCQQGGLNGRLAGEHPSRTLFVRNLNSNVEDTELKALFEQYGDIREIYTACKYQGFIMVSYYDIRSALNAMRALQSKSLMRRKLDIHYSIPKENPSDEDTNQGTIVVFNLDPSVSKNDLLRIFGFYGEIKEILETPHEHHHKFIEFYDIRAAEAALTLNRSDIAGKKIKVEPSRPGGATRTLVQQFSPAIGHDELNGCNQGSPINSLAGYFGSIHSGLNKSNDLEPEAASSFQAAVRPPVKPLMDSTFQRISSSLSQKLSSPVRIPSVAHFGNQYACDDLSHSLTQMKVGYQGMPTFHPSSLPEYNYGLTDGTYNSRTMSALGLNIIRPPKAVENRHLKKLTSGSLKSSAFGHNGGAFGLSRCGSSYLHEHQHGWNSTNAFQNEVISSIPWSNPASFVNNIVAHQNGLPKPLSLIPNSALPLHHVGSAPAANPTPRDNQHVYPGDAKEFHSGSPGSLQLRRLELASQNIAHSISPANVGIPSPQKKREIFHGGNQVVHHGSFDSPTYRIRSRRNNSSVIQSDDKKQYELDMDRIVNGKDSRTTLMIKNIPNRYSAEMLLQVIDESHRRTYDFLYLPIDFKNNCNMGYAFINMTATQHIVPFYQTFNGKKWEKFNSEKVASIAYARIQGKAALVSHFRNSSLINEDKRCRPILFCSDGPNAGEMEPFPTVPNIRSKHGRSRSANDSEEKHQEITSTAPDVEACDALASPSGSTRDSE